MCLRKMTVERREDARKSGDEEVKIYVSLCTLQVQYIENKLETLHFDIRTSIEFRLFHS